MGLDHFNCIFQAATKYHESPKHTFIHIYIYIYSYCTRVSFIHVLHSLPFHLQDDHKAFRRQLEDKRPIVESNLTSGRQYIANEAAVSDTSDTEGKFYGHQRHTKKSPAKLPIKGTTKRFSMNLVKCSCLVAQNRNWIC